MITELTPQQQELLPRWRQEWFEVGTSTAAADRRLAEATIASMYGHVGEPHNPWFVWCDSPMTVTLARHTLLEWAKAQPLESSLRSSLESSLWSSLESSLRSSLRSSLGSSLGSSLESSLWSSLGSSLESSLWSSLRSSLESSLRSSLESSLRSSLESSLGSSLESSLESSLRSSLESSLWSSLRSSLRSSLGSSLESSLWSSLESSPLSVPTYLWGQHEAAWISFYRFCEAIGVKYAAESSTHLDWWEQLCRSVNWWSPYMHVCFASERPSVVRMEPWPQQNAERIHCEDGPAVKYRDGWAVYAWHGTVVPSKVIEAPDTLSPHEIVTHANAEVRRAMIERFGQERLMREGKAVRIHSDDWGTLWKLDLDDDEPICMVEVVNSTPEPDGSYKNYMIRVDERCRPLMSDDEFGNPQPPTALNAIASTFGMTGEEYASALQVQT